MKKILLIFIWIITIILSGSIYVKIMYPTNYYKDEIEKYAKQYNIDKELVYSIINNESHFNPEAVSNKGACGLMQVMPKTMEYMTGENQSEKLFEAEYNIMVGVKYFRYLMDKFNNDILISLYGYNAGEGNTRKWLNGEGEPFNQTKIYAKKVINEAKIYKKLLKWQY